jgi:hypothetical protein
LLLAKELIELVAYTSASEAEEPNTALYVVPLVLVTSPALLEIEKSVLLLASPPQVCPSEAVPQNVWLARWNVS